MHSSSTEPTTGGHDEFMTVVDNHIWFYSDIEDIFCMHLNAMLRKIDRDIAAQPNPVIYLHIHSYGGSVISALSTIDTIRNLRSSVHTIVEGGAASAATLISCIGARRFIGKHSFMLIHQVRGDNSGKLDEMEEQLQNTRQFMDTIKRIYKTCTKIPAKRMEELLKSDKWLDADSCLALGLVDEVI